MTMSSTCIPLKWQMNAVTRIGTAVNKLHTDEIPVKLGRNLGRAILPLNNLIIATPAVMTRKTIASAIANADEYLNESANMKIKKNVLKLKIMKSTNHMRLTEFLNDTVVGIESTYPFQARQWSKYKKSCNKQNKETSIPPMLPKPSFKNPNMVNST